jgi:autotransporter-associated beta strand protein
LASGVPSALYGSYDLSVNSPTLSRIIADGGAMTSIISAQDVRLSIPTGSIFEVRSGTAPGGIDLDVTGTLNGAQGLRKEGVGLMRLGNSVHGYYGNTVVAEGTLRVLGTLPNSPRIEVAAGATIDFSPSYTFAATQTLAGNGSFTGDIAGAGNISPGASTGTLTVTGAADLTGSALNIEIDETQIPVSDVLAVSGALDLDGATLAVTVTGTPSQESYIIATYGSLTGTFASHTGIPEGYEIDYTFNGGKAVAIKRAGSAYNVWAASFGLDPIGNGAPNADPDGDNLDNLLEYSLFSSPTDSHSRPAISVAVDGTAISLTYRRSKVAAEVSFIPEWSTNLVDWFTTGMTDLPTGAEDGNTNEYRASTSKDGAAGKFVRVRVNRP